MKEKYLSSLGRRPCSVYTGIHPKLSLSLNLWSVNVCFNPQVILTCVSAAHVLPFILNSDATHRISVAICYTARCEMLLAQRQFLLKMGNLSCWVGKVENMLDQGLN